MADIDRNALAALIEALEAGMTVDTTKQTD